MKIRTLFLISLCVAVSASCAGRRNLRVVDCNVVNMDRAGGYVDVGGNFFGYMNKHWTFNNTQAHTVAETMCTNWGYSGAVPTGGVFAQTQGVRPSGMFGYAPYGIASVKFQCTGEAKMESEVKQKQTDKKSNNKSNNNKKSGSYYIKQACWEGDLEACEIIKKSNRK